ncbi:MAG: hypothetical protein GY780_18480 [bacterium]|nr:hypothetical protein [bacterium]
MFRILLVFLIFVIPSAAICDNNIREFMLQEIDEMDCSARLEFSLFDKSKGDVFFDNLMGAISVTDDGLVIFDRIGDQLMSLSFDNQIHWSVGSKGSGPEDHFGPCEPFSLNSGLVGVADYSPQSKVLYYSNSGEFKKSILFPATKQCQQIEPYNGGFIAIWNSVEKVDFGFASQISLVALDADAVLLSSTLIKESLMEKPKPGRRIPADVWRPFPRMCLAEDGYVFIQKDTRKAIFEVFNEKLEYVKTIGSGWQGIKRDTQIVQDEIDELHNKVDSFLLEQAGEHVFARPNGRLWVQRSNRTADSVEFEVLNRFDNTVGAIKISSMPSQTGDYKIWGDKLLWVEDADRSDGDGNCVGLYRLIEIKK